jgi:hypothetical protein
MEGSVIFYTTGCPKCAILKKKLDAAHIPYTENRDVDEMQALGMTEAPALSVGGELMSFGDSVRWVNEWVSERTPAG